MIAHHDELWMTAPAGDAPILAAVHVDRGQLESAAVRLTREGWRHPDIVTCRACARTPIPA